MCRVMSDNCRYRDAVSILMDFIVVLFVFMLLLYNNNNNNNNKPAIELCARQFLIYLFY